MIGETSRRYTIEGVTTRRVLYWLAAMFALLVMGTVIGLIWADTSNVAGAFAGVTNVVSVVGIVVLLVALAVKRRRRRLRGGSLQSHKPQA
jgi:membrane protein YdbS with pleckstrin-like domain